MEATTRFELVNGAFAELCLTAWLCRRFIKTPALVTGVGFYGAEDERRLKSFFQPQDMPL